MARLNKLYKMLSLHCCAVIIVYSLSLTDFTMGGTLSHYFHSKLDLPQKGGNTKNLSAITWAHAVNDKKLLRAALDSDVMMLEADVIMGILISDPNGKPLPVMGHPPQNESDMSLEQFLRTIYDYNQNKPALSMKGVKLDFKSIDVFDGSIAIIEKLYHYFVFPLWLNADILPGPINSKVKPVNPDRFLSGAKKFQRSNLSIGWTTLYGQTNSNGSYTDAHIDEMLHIVGTKGIGIQQDITFPVRAGLAAQSSKTILRLTDKLKDSTLTIWSSVGDPVNVEDLRKLIFTVGLDRIYVDVPEELRKDLHLDQRPQ